MLFHEGLGIVPDISLAIAINSRHIAEHAASFFDMGLLKLSLKFFNTFVRMCIESGLQNSGAENGFRTFGIGRVRTGCLFFVEKAQYLHTPFQ